MHPKNTSVLAVYLKEKSEDPGDRMLWHRDEGTRAKLLDRGECFLPDGTEVWVSYDSSQMYRFKMFVLGSDVVYGEVYAQEKCVKAELHTSRDRSDVGERVLLAPMVVA